ncbi:MAG TPA: phosphatidylserine decarboxylase [Stellaceae bacterium]|jgi:phosphatidylserine decarboxylase|nr:phosphatidylserine decarboxylase [Stellaceae bacterium]
MLRSVLAPIHPDGWRFIAAAVVVALLLFWLGVAPLGWLALVVAAWITYFFRDPWRVTPSRAGLVVSAADGVVVAADRVPPPKELEMGEAPMTRIGVFLNVFDVHVNRVPLGGRVKKLAYSKGRFINASLDKASEQNERMAIRITSTEGPDVAVVQIAGLIARRIVCTLGEGQEVATGERLGLIRFGSRTDVYLPAEWAPLVVKGQRVVGGETVIADAAAPEPQREGRLH